MMTICMALALCQPMRAQDVTTQPVTQVGNEENVGDIPISFTTRATRELNYFRNRFTGDDNEYNRALLLALSDWLLKEFPENYQTDDMKNMQAARSTAETLLDEMLTKARHKAKESNSHVVYNMIGNCYDIVNYSYGPEVLTSVQRSCQEFNVVKGKKAKSMVFDSLIEYIVDESQSTHISLNTANQIRSVLSSELIPNLTKRQQKKLVECIAEMVEDATL